MNTFLKFAKYGSFFIIAILMLASTSCKRQTRAEVKKVKVDDIEIAYYKRGDGPPLLMIMGFRGTMAVWDPRLLEELEKHFTLILFDNRGVGLSTDTQEDHTTISQMATDSTNLVKALGYQKVNVLGWSMGSRIALKMAIIHPEIVDKLILCSPNPGGKHQVPRSTQSLKSLEELTSAKFSQEKILSLLYPETKNAKIAASLYVARMAEAIAAGSVPNDLHINDETIERQVRALIRWDQNNDNFEAFANIRSPTLVTEGMEDVLDHPENARIVANKIPFAWSAYFPGAGHAFLSQDYESFTTLVRLFLQT